MIAAPLGGVTPRPVQTLAHPTDPAAPWTGTPRAQGLAATTEVFVVRRTPTGEERAVVRVGDWTAEDDRTVVRWSDGGAWVIRAAAAPPPRPWSADDIPLGPILVAARHGWEVLPASNPRAAIADDANALRASHLHVLPTSTAEGAP